MSNLTHDLALILQDNGFGTIGVDIFGTADLPPKPDAMIMIINTGTFMPDYPSVSLVNPVTAPTAQFIVRESKGNGQIGESRINVLNIFLRTVKNYRVQNSEFAYINQLSGPTELPVDELMRPMFSLNVNCKKIIL